MLFLALRDATGDARYERAMHASLKRAAETAHDGGIGLFAGVSGLRAAAALAARREPRYQRLVARCDAHVEAALAWPPEAPGSFSEYDVIAGWAGARLARCIEAPREADRLTDLLAWVLDEDRWCCRHPLRPDEPPAHDLGLAHGIAGVLAALALTHERFDAVLAERLLQAGRFLASCAIERDGYYVWPPWAEHEPAGSMRSAWCYGAPGVTAALHTVATLLGDDELAAFALNAQRRIAQRTARECAIDDIGMCHGIVGNAVCFASVAEAADCDELRTYAEDWLGHALTLLERGASADAHTALALLAFSGDAPAGWLQLHALRPL